MPLPLQAAVAVVAVAVPTNQVSKWLRLEPQVRATSEQMEFKTTAGAAVVVLALLEMY